MVPHGATVAKQPEYCACQSEVIHLLLSHSHTWGHNFSLSRSHAWGLKEATSSHCQLSDKRTWLLSRNVGVVVGYMHGFTSV